MPPIVLKLQDNESFLPFSNLDQDELSKTWRVCTKVKDSLENGSRLENLSWRLWFIQNVLVSNDVKSKQRKKKHKAAIRKLESTTLPTVTTVATTVARLNNSNMISPQEQQSVLDYSLDEIEPVLCGGATENFILHQFTSDQEDNQMIQLSDIFLFNMQDDFMYNTISSQQDMAGIQIYHSESSNTSTWREQQQPQQQFYHQSNNVYSSTSNVPSYPSTANASPISSPFPTTTTSANYLQQHNLAADPITGICSLISSGALNFPPQTASILPAQDMMNLPCTDQQEQSLIVDFNNAAYVAAAAAATAAALTTLPNATLHNKLLATLPRQTLASAERLLSPADKRRPSIMTTQQQKMTESLPSIPRQDQQKNSSSKKKHGGHQQQHYYSTFQLDTGEGTHSSRTTAATTRNKYEYNNITTKTASIASSSKSDTMAADEKPPQCSNCDATSTPLWRRSNDDKVLCNACGLYLRLHNIPRPKHLKPSGGKNKLMESINNHHQDEEDSIMDQVQPPQSMCSNCGTNKTPLWRRDVEGLPLCNACGLYLKLHNEKRPLSMKTDVIKKRQRTEALLAASTSSGSESDQSKKPRYYDQQSLLNHHASEISLGYRNAVSSLPGTGILMMTSVRSPHSSS